MLERQVFGLTCSGTHFCVRSRRRFYWDVRCLWAREWLWTRAKGRPLLRPAGAGRGACARAPPSAQDGGSAPPEIPRTPPRTDPHRRSNFVRRPSPPAVQKWVCLLLLSAIRAPVPSRLSNFTGTSCVDSAPPPLALSTRSLACLAFLVMFLSGALVPLTLVAASVVARPVADTLGKWDATSRSQTVDSVSDSSIALVRRKESRGPSPGGRQRGAPSLAGPVRLRLGGQVGRFGDAARRCRR